MNAKVNDVMVAHLMTMTPHQTIGHVRQMMRKHHVSCFPVVNSEGEPVGIVTSSDLLADHADGTPISQIMSRKVYTIPRYADPSLAARIMRNHHTHHLVVTNEKIAVGIISSFDLLALLEEHRFVLKNSPGVSSRGGARKRNETLSSP